MPATAELARPGEQALIAAIEGSSVLWLGGPLHVGSERCRSALRAREARSGADPGLLAGVVVSGADAKTDGVLSAREWARLDLSQTRLVVLAGAPAPGATGEGFVTLRLAVASAGAAAVAHGLWDPGSEALLAVLTSRRRGAKRPAATLREAQLDVLAEVRSSGIGHAGHWSGVVVTGLR